MTVALVLAGGAGSRFTGPGHKLLSDFRGRPLLAWAAGHALAAGIGPVVVVSGAIDVSSAVPPGVTVVANPRWALGMATSLQAGIAFAREAGHDAVVVGLGDQPLVPAQAWRAVAESDGAIAAATFRGDRRPPVRLTAEVWPLLPEVGDVGARSLMAVRPELVVEVPVDGEPADVDTVEDLHRWT